MNALRSMLLAAAGANPSRRARSVPDVPAAIRLLRADGALVTVGHLAVPARDQAQAERATLARLELLELLPAGQVAELELDPAALGLEVEYGLAVRNVERICAAAWQRAVGVTLRTGDGAVQPALRLLAELRLTWPGVGVALRADLPRTEADAVALGTGGSRVRLYPGPRGGHPADLAYLRCANALLEGAGHPVFATGDRRLLAVLAQRVHWYGWGVDQYEYELPCRTAGGRPPIAGVSDIGAGRADIAGARVRVHLPVRDSLAGRVPALPVSSS